MKFYFSIKKEESEDSSFFIQVIDSPLNPHAIAALRTCRPMFLEFLLKRRHHLVSTDVQNLVVNDQAALLL